MRKIAPTNLKNTNILTIIKFMDKLLQYIQSTFNSAIDLDAKQCSANSKLCLLTKQLYNIYVTPIKFQKLKFKQNEYIQHIQKATFEWSKALNHKIQFKIIDTTKNADIKVYWGKSTIEYAGMQYTECNSSINTLCVTIGIVNNDYTTYTSNEVYRIILHEFGHIMGLGHSPSKDDVMHNLWKHPDKLSFNDKLVLNLIYSIGNGKSYYEFENYINDYIQKSLKNTMQEINTDKNLLNDLYEIGNLNKHILLQQNINIPK